MTGSLSSGQTPDISEKSLIDMWNETEKMEMKEKNAEDYGDGAVALICFSATASIFEVLATGWSFRFR